MAFGSHLFKDRMQSEFSLSIDSCWKSLSEYMTDQSTLPLVGAVAAMGIGAAAGAYYVNKRSDSHKVSPIFSLKNQSVEHPNGEGGRVNRLVENGKLYEVLIPGVTTIYECIRNGAKESSSGDCLGYRKKMPDGTQPYTWISYSEVIERSTHVAAGFLEKGLKPGNDTFIGIYAQNCPEWTLTEHACYQYSMVNVPLYDTLGPDSCSYIIDKTNIELVVVDKNAKAEGLISQKKDCPSLKVIVLIEEISEQVKSEAEEAGVEVLSFQSLESSGRNARDLPTPIPPKPDDLATICFTSGTTGTPKGVMLTHGNIVADTAPLYQFKNSGVNCEDTMISFLPLAHMFERMIENSVLTIGARIGFFRGDIRQLTDDIKELRPTLMPVVPRLLNRVYDKVMQEVTKSRLKKYLFDWALRSKTEELNNSIVRHNSIWDKVIFKKVREGMGGRIKLMITGSAPLSECVLTFMRAALGCFVVEGYGQTECVACATVTVEGDHIPGHVGPPAVCNEIRMMDVPEMGYFSSAGKGEICIRGPNVFKGYFKDEERTREVLDEDGWLHTGDIGQWTESGAVKIVDRKKHIFKLAQGEYVAPEKIENVYLRSSLVAQAYVYGESLKSCLVGIIVPDPEVLPKAVRKQLGVNGKSVAELCQDPAVKKMVLDSITRTGKESGLHSFEQVKDIHLFGEMWSVDNGLLTPTLKSRRPELHKYFESDIQRMYSSLS